MDVSVYHLVCRSLLTLSLMSIRFVLFCFVGFFAPIDSFSCLSKCSSSFARSLDLTSCSNETSEELCKAQLIVYYKGQTRPLYVNYTFGTFGDAMEKSHEDELISFGLTNLTKFQVMVNANQAEAILTVDIYCTHTNQCAWLAMTDLFQRYQQQVNPYYAVKSLIHTDPSPKDLTCVDTSNDTQQTCTSVDRHAVCVLHFRDQRYECASSADVRVYLEFLVSSPRTIELDVKSGVVQCNRDHCNTIGTFLKVQRIGEDYANGRQPISSSAVTLTTFSALLFLFSSLYLFN